MCVCDVWWTGPTCDLLNLAPPDNEHHGLQVPNYYSWGGHAAQDANLTWHGFFSFICNGSTLNAWTTRSSIWHATAASVTGPYELSDMVSQPWAHNAMLSANPSGAGYLLWQIGNSVTPPHEWETCYEEVRTSS